VRLEYEVARFSTIPEGELAVAVLNRHGIAARLPDRDMATMNPDLLIAIGGVRVVAPSDQIDEARRLIARVRAGDLVDESEDWQADHVPGRVGELDETEITGAMGWAKRAGTIVIVLAFVVFPLAGCLLSWTGR
jgi:2-keto-3-deoxy-galactonokinase